VITADAPIVSTVQRSAALMSPRALVQPMVLQMKACFAGLRARWPWVEQSASRIHIWADGMQDKSVRAGCS
jgi:hypothetical protein